ncbi:MAG: two-component regulator propeller domain-containing protein, partial [Bacteroidota bacterium]
MAGTAGFAQQPGYIRYTDSDGLPSMNIYDILQDDDGYLWLGTENGLCRFNGREMETYSSPIITDFEVLTIDYSANGRIWFTNFSGQLYFIQHNEIHRFTHPALDPDRKITSVSISPQDHLWITVNGGIYEFTHLETGNYQFEAFYNTGHSSFHHSNIAFTSDGRAWVPYRINSRILKANCLQDLPEKDTFPELRNFDCWIDNLGNDEMGVFCAFGAGLVREGEFFPVFGELSSFNKIHGVTKVFRDNDHQYWVCTHTGTYLF